MSKQLRQRYTPWIILGGLIALLSAFCFWSVERLSSTASDADEEEITADADDSTPLFLEDVARAADDGKTHRLYPFSIVPGGVRSASEIHKAMHADRLVAEHYADLNVGRMHRVRVAEARLAYVSYRRDDRIYWTRKALVIPAGEDVLTDGAHWVRARCGNRLSALPQDPVSKAEPPAGIMDTPLAEAKVALPRKLEGWPLGLPGIGVGAESFGPLGSSPTGVSPLGLPGARSVAAGQGGHSSTLGSAGSGIPIWSEPPPPISGVITHHDVPPPGIDVPPDTGDWPGPPDTPPTDTLPPTEPIPTPEPSTMLLVGSALAGYVARRRKR